MSFSRSFEFELSKVFDLGDWSGKVKPSIQELPRYASEESMDRMMVVLKRFSRVVIIDFKDRSVSELGLGRHQEGRDSSENFEITVVSGSYDDLMQIFNRLRKISIDSPRIYKKIQFSSPVIGKSRLEVVATFTVNAFIVGRGIDDV